ncbi:MAG: tetratricopeptide repeat protein [Alphaproteobacteria bacterium]|nr:tetratricopeptide repeat protein [Alphaproteobacteria bacterium]
MARIVAALSRETLAGMDAKMEALAKLEAFSEEVDAVLARRKSNSAVRRAVKAWRRGNIPRAGQLALAATEADDTNSKAFHVLAMALERMGHLHKALVTYERAVALDPDDPELLIDLGMTAWNLKMKEGAVKMFEMYIAARPDSPLGYNNLGSVQGDMGKLTTAIETLRSAIYRMPSEAILWNSLATVLAEEGRVEESLVFYNEAVKLEPGFGRPYHNLGYAYQHLGRLAEALESYDNALVHMTDPGEIMEAKHSRSICLIGMGRLEEGFREYEIRNDERFRAYIHHMVKAPLWRGEPLDGKHILITGEQGLGDEFMFANILPDLQRAVGPNGKLQIGVDRRLHTLFKRSFPDADVGNCDDRMLIDHNGKKELRFVPFAVENGTPDFYAPMGTPLHVFRKRIEDFPHEAFLKPDPERVAHFRDLLQANGPGPYVGICWRSMLIDTKRAKYYSALDMWGPILKTPGVRFVNIQYGDCADELARAREMHGVDIQTIEGLDLKNDIDGAAALSAALDLAISAPTAAAACAGSVGTEVWFLTAGRTWPQLGTDEFPWYRKSHVFSPTKFGDWNELMPRVAERLAAFAAS